MPIDCQYKPETQMLYCTASGWITLDDFKGALMKIISSNEYSADVRTLWDIRELDLDSITKELANGLVELRKGSPERGNTRMVIIAEEDHSFGMSRMYEMLSSDLPQQIMVFRDFKEGEKWLMDQ